MATSPHYKQSRPGPLVESRGIMTFSLTRIGTIASGIVLAATLTATPAVALPQQQSTITLRDAAGLLIVEGPSDGTPMFERAIAPAPCPSSYNTSARLMFTPEGGEPIAISADTKLADPAKPAELTPEIPFIDVAGGAPAGDLGIQCLANEPDDFPNPAPEMTTLHVTFPTETTYRVDPLPVPDTSTVTLTVDPVEPSTAPATVTANVTVDPAADGTITFVDATTGVELGSAALTNGVASTELTLSASATIKALFTPADARIVAESESAPVAITIAGVPAPAPSASATSDTNTATTTPEATTEGDLSSTGGSVLPALIALSAAAVLLGGGYLAHKRRITNG